MTLGKWLAVGGTLTALMVPLVGSAPYLAPAAASPAAHQTVNTKTLLRELTVGPTFHSGYVRTKFQLWTSHPDGCDTRQHVLIRDAVVKPHVGAGCSLTGGRWKSPYDGIVTHDSSAVQVDHMVPLAAAWGAGAWHWTPTTRRNYANDLGTSYDLLAVSGHANESKGDQSPDTWLPPRRSFDCRYMADYTAVLWRWQLNVNPAQQRFLHSRLHRCHWPSVVEPHRPTIGKHPTGGGGGGRKGQVATGIKIAAITFDSPGDDTGSNSSLNSEWVKITNTSAKRAALGSWGLHDASGHLFTFPTFHLAAHHDVEVHTGSGNGNASNLYWGSTEYIWNNTGDKATLVTPNGKVADKCSYSSSGATTHTSC